jgi:hypothetical protein
MQDVGACVDEITDARILLLYGQLCQPGSVSNLSISERFTEFG